MLPAAAAAAGTPFLPTTNSSEATLHYILTTLFYCFTQLTQPRNPAQPHQINGPSGANSHTVDLGSCCSLQQQHHLPGSGTAHQKPQTDTSVASNRRLCMIRRQPARSVDLHLLAPGAGDGPAVLREPTASAVALGLGDQLLSDQALHRHHVAHAVVELLALRVER